MLPQLLITFLGRWFLLVGIETYTPNQLSSMDSSGQILFVHDFALTVLVRMAVLFISISR
jgi:hypothetical protein